MTTSQHPARWSKKIDGLVQYVADRCRPGMQSELGDWLASSPRFQAFLSSHQDKVRKKLTSADGEDGRLDVRAELLVAYLVLADRRFALEFEAYGAHRLGPDFTVTYRANQRFDLEVTRLRATTESGPGRLANVIAGKLRQMTAQTPNVLLISAAVPLTEEHLVEATRVLKSHSDQKDDDFFARRGLHTARDFYARYLRLSGILVMDESAAQLSPNREARHPLPAKAASALVSALASRRP